MVGLFIGVQQLDSLVDILSDHGKWLEATELSLKLIPDRTSLLQAECWIPVKTLDKIVSRAERFNFDSKEAKYVVDVRTDNDLQDLMYSVALLKKDLSMLVQQAKNSGISIKI